MWIKLLAININTAVARIGNHKLTITPMMFSPEMVGLQSTAAATHLGRRNDETIYTHPASEVLRT
jgi:hypothetical protein